jgi:PAS domain S-box-containing protein
VTFDGKEYNCAFATDISERKRMEEELRHARDELEKRVEERTAELARATEALRESEARLNLNMDLAKLVQWDYDIKIDMFTFDDRFYALYGTTAEREGGPQMSSSAYAAKFLPAEDSSLVAREIARAMASTDANFTNQVEHRILRADGEVRFIVVRCTAVRDQEGRIVRTLGANQDITERKRIEEALRASEREKSLILNITHAHVIYFDPDMNILWANLAAGDSVNLAPEELQKRHCWEVWHQRSEPCPDCPVLAARETGQPQEAEICTPDGRVWFIRAYPVRNDTGRLIGMVEFTQDFTERKQMEEALRQANLVVENSPVVLFRWKGKDEWPVELVSRNIIQFGYTPDEFLSGSITYASIILPDDLDRVTREVYNFCNEGADQLRLEYRIRTKGGEIRWVSEHTNVERNAAGDVKNFEGIVIDITERKLIEEQLKRQKQQLEELNHTLEHRVQEEVVKNREKDIMLIQQNRQAAMGDLLEHIAHQLKQPLTVASLLVQNLWDSHTCNELTAENIQETINKTTDLLEHMAQTIEVFRDFYRPDKEKTAFRISDSVDNALTFISPALKNQSIAVELDVDSGLLATGYPREYIQVLLNVLSNARDALKERKTEKPKIMIKGIAEGNRAVVTITDNAGGIPESIVSNIFDLYVTTKEASGGTGIGLHMSKNIIEKNMHGSLTAHNTDSGAQFRIAVNMPDRGAL